MEAGPRTRQVSAGFSLFQQKIPLQLVTGVIFSPTSHTNESKQTADGRAAGTRDVQAASVSVGEELATAAADSLSAQAKAHSGSFHQRSEFVILVELADSQRPVARRRKKDVSLR